MNPPETARTLRTWLEEGPFALALSAGFFGFYAHCGVIAALEEAGFEPCRASGASAGALTLAFWASGMDADTMVEEIQKIRRQDFWDPWPGPGLLRGRKLRRLLERHLPVTRFEDCRFPLAISSWDVLLRRTRVFDAGPLAPPVHASCALPGLFHPVWIAGRPFVDGGVRDRPGIAGLVDEGRVLYHHLVPRRTRRPERCIPRREGLTTLVIRDLPRPGPSCLELGPAAIAAARDATRTALDREVNRGEVIV